MKVFLTGSTGYIGSAVLDALVRAGHQVAAFVRDPSKAERVLRHGVQPVVGDLLKPDTYAGVVESCDGAIHAAFDLSQRDDTVDRAALDTLVAALRRRRETHAARPFLVYTSGIWVVGSTAKPADEQTPLDPTPLVAWRLQHEDLVLQAGEAGLRAIVVRPGIVYGRSRGLIADLLKDASNGLVRVIGNGKQHWPCVYDRDLADLYARLVSSENASGVYHANDEADERLEDIVEAISQHMAMKPDVRHVPLPEARNKLGHYADALALDQKIRSPRARALGWSPTLHSVTGNIARLVEEFRRAREAAA